MYFLRPFFKTTSTFLLQKACKHTVYIGAFLFTAGLTQAQQVLIIPQIADGGGFQTEFVMNNTTAAVGTVSFTCQQDTTAGATTAWSLPILESVNLQNIPLPAAGTVFLHTPGTATALSEGWCQLNASQGVNAYALFTQFVPGRPNQYGTAPAAPSASRILVPFDNTAGFVTSVAIANTTGTAELVSVSTQTDAGMIAQQTAVMLPANGQLAFTIPSQFGASLNNERGVAEFSTTTGNIAILALAFNSSGSFTASPVYAQTGPPLIGVQSIVGGTPFSSFAINGLVFQPSGAASSSLALAFTPNSGSTTFSVAISGGPTFVDGTFTNQGQTFTASTLQTNASTPPFGIFASPAGNFLVSSASLSFTLVPEGSQPSPLGVVQEGSITGTFTVTGTASPGGGSPVTLSGTITGTYSGLLVP
jgi:hypothetical protein